MFDYSQFGDQYQNWLKYTQSGLHGNPLQQNIDALGKMMQQSFMQGMPWANMSPAFGSNNGIHWPFMGDMSALNSNMQAMGNKFQQMQEAALQIYKLTTGTAKLDEVRGELVQLGRQLSTMLVEEMNSLAGNIFVIQFVNNVRTGLDMQRKLLEEQQVQAAMTPYHSEFEGYVHSCKLWQDVCEHGLGMLDLLQQFSESFGEHFADTFMAKIDKDDFAPQSAEQVIDFFVQIYEKQFVELLGSDSYSQTHGAFVNSLVAVRADQQKHIDKVVEALGLPSKREMDTNHKRVRQNTKDLRDVKHFLQQKIDTCTKQIADQQQLIDQLQKSLHTFLEKRQQDAEKAQQKIETFAKQITGQQQLIDQLQKSLHTLLEKQPQDVEKAQRDAEVIAPKVAKKAATKPIKTGKSAKPTKKVSATGNKKSIKTNPLASSLKSVSEPSSKTSIDKQV